MLRNKKGVIVLFFALLLTAVVGLGAMVIDVSQTYSLRSRVKNAIDLSSLAGTSQLDGTQSGITNAKNTTLTYLNNNLTMTIASFNSLTLNSTGLSVQAGVYDSSSMTFTQNEANPANVNALRLSYSYTSMSYLANIFMINNFSLSEAATTAKQAAGQALPGSGFPLVLYNTALDTALANGNMVNLYSAGNMDNSFWSDFTGSNPSTTDIRNVLDYFQTGMGTTPPAINVNDSFRVNDGGMGGIFLNMDPNFLVGMTFLLAVVTPTMDYVDNKEVRADGFVAATINNIVDSMGQKYVGITIQPGYVDNTFGGLQIGSGVTNVSSSNQPLLATGFGIVQ